MGTWKNSVYTDVYTIYPDGSAQDVHSGITSSGTWAQQNGQLYGHDYGYIWYWTFGPPPGLDTRGNFIDYIYIVNNDYVTYVNNYGNTGSDYRIS